jgi:hypothetical protein
MAPSKRLTPIEGCLVEAGTRSRRFIWAHRDLLAAIAFDIVEA